MFGLFEGEPDFVNEIGTKWWIDKNSTQWAQKLYLHGIVVFCVEETNGKRCFLITKDQVPLKELVQYEGVGFWLDGLAAVIYGTAKPSLLDEEVRDKCWTEYNSK